MRRISIIIALIIAAIPAVAQQRHKAIERASKHIIEYRFEEGERIIDSLLAKNPQNSDALYMQAVSYFGQDNYPEALDCCNRAIDSHTKRCYYDDCYLYFCRGEIKVALGEIEGASNDFTEALALSDDKNGTFRAQILIKRAHCSLYLDDYVSAQRYLNAASTYDDGSSTGEIAVMLAETYIYLGQYKKAVTTCDELIELGTHTFQAYRYKAIAYYGLRDLKASVDNAIAMIKENPIDTNPEELDWLLWHDIDYARRALRQSILEDTGCDYLAEHLTIAHIVNDNDAALDLLAQTDNADIADYITYWRAEFSSKAGRYDDATRFITTLIDTATVDDKLYVYVSERCKYYRLAGEYDKALADASRLVELQGDDAYGHYIRGWIYELMGNDDAAMECYNNGIAADDSYAYIYLMRGEQYLKYGNTERAKADFELVLELDNAASHGTARHYALHFLGRDKEAIAWMEHLVYLYPHYADTRYDEACLYARMGNVERALDALRMALDLGYKAKAHIEHDDDLDPIRSTEAYQRLMEEYFNE